MQSDTKTDVQTVVESAEKIIEQTTEVVDATMFFQGLAFKARKRELDARPMLEPPRILKRRLAEVEEKVVRVEGKLRRSAASTKGWETRRANALRLQQQEAARRQRELAEHAAVWELLRGVQERLHRNPHAGKRTDDGRWICLPDNCLKIVGRGPSECAYCLT